MRFLRISFQTHEDDTWIFGREWFLYGGLEENEVEFSTDWMRLK